MKTVKLNKKMLTMHPADLLVKLGAINKDKNLAFPHHVYFSKEDYKTLEKNLKAKLIEAGCSAHMAVYSVGMEMLNYGPNQSLENAVRPGWALVNFDAIKESKQ